MTADWGGGRTHDEALLEGVESDWGSDPPDPEDQRCRDCGELMVFANGRWSHIFIMPRPPYVDAPYGSDTYWQAERAWGAKLGRWTLRTSTHRARL